jgi:ABC-type hemin transport system substrate-binding protein
MLLVVMASACRDEAAPSGPTTFEPPRVISCSAEVTHLLDELGVVPALDLGERCALAPDEASRLAPALRVLLDGEPDDARARALAERGVETVVLAPRSANEIAAAHHELASRLGRPDLGIRSMARLTGEVSAIATRRDGLARHRVIWIVARDPLVAVGGAGLLHEILELAGGENGIHGEPDERRTVTPEEIAASAPDLVLDSSGAAEALALPASIPVRRLAPGLARVPALDLAGRVRAVYAALYPESAPAL